MCRFKRWFIDFCEKHQIDRILKDVRDCGLKKCENAVQMCG